MKKYLIVSVDELGNPKETTTTGDKDTFKQILLLYANKCKIESISETK